MPQETVELELLDGSRVNACLIWLFAVNGGAPYYLQAVRAWPPEKAACLRDGYVAMERFYASRLADLIQCSPGYVFAPPSRYLFARTFRDTYKAGRLDVPDISDRFRKSDESVVAGENDTTAADVYESLLYDQVGDECKIVSILMIDDIVADMKTVRAALTRLVEAGMSRETEITVACPLRLGKRRHLLSEQRAGLMPRD